MEGPWNIFTELQLGEKEVPDQRSIEVQWKNEVLCFPFSTVYAQHKSHRKLRRKTLKRLAVIFHCIFSTGSSPDSITQQPPIVFLGSTRQSESPKNDFALVLVPSKLQDAFHPCLEQSVVLRAVFVNSFVLLSVSCQLSLLLRFLLAVLSMLMLLTALQLNHWEQNSSQCTKPRLTQNSSDALSSKSTCK